MIRPASTRGRRLEYSNFSGAIEARTSGTCPQYKDCAGKVCWWILPTVEAAIKVYPLSQAPNSPFAPCQRWRARNSRRLPLLGPRRLSHEGVPWRSRLLWRPLAPVRRPLSRRTAPAPPTGWREAARYSRVALPRLAKSRGDPWPRAALRKSICREGWNFVNVLQRCNPHGARETSDEDQDCQAEE